jgi:hypothetical protein
MQKLCGEFLDFFSSTKLPVGVHVIDSKEHTLNSNIGFVISSAFSAKKIPANNKASFAEGKNKREQKEEEVQ